VTASPVRSAVQTPGTSGLGASSRFSAALPSALSVSQVPPTFLPASLPRCALVAAPAPASLPLSLTYWEHVAARQRALGLGLGDGASAASSPLKVPCVCMCMKWGAWLARQRGLNDSPSATCLHKVRRGHL